MPRLERSALVPFAAEAVCALVNDVERYPEFLRWCTAAEALAREGDEVTASLTLKGLGRTESLVTRNRVEEGRRIVLKLVRGPFRRLQGVWTFTPVGHGCRIHLSLEFELEGGLLRLLGAPLTRRAADALVDAFSERAHAVLGQ